VLFVHNTIFDIEKIAGMLKRIMPGARTGVAHGRMAEKSLEEVMHRFLRKDLDILLSTNIIGAGIDIPTANTILIDKADKMGLADLYQLRGRVGRSNVRAYAYFLIPGEDVMTDEAKKRLQAMREMSFLGAGFRLAMKDMEIRGAGNLLGPQQSGHIHAVGFDMYVEMLEKAVAEAKGEEVREEVEPTINLKRSAFIPETYIEDVTLRLSLYRRIAGAKEGGAVDAIETEMADRFGDVPPEVRGLLDIMRLKILARQLHISAVSEGDSRVRFVFSEETPVVPERIFGLQKTYAGIRFHQDGFEFNLKGLQKDRKDLSALFEVMKSLS
jgi:transcription-repair coupling factor (superfamily II helicase)